MALVINRQLVLYFSLGLAVQNGNGKTPRGVLIGTFLSPAFDRDSFEALRVFTSLECADPLGVPCD